MLWIQDILTATLQPESITSIAKGIRGIDIGTGASVIYPLLACAMAPNWSFIATEIDHGSLIAAEKNIAGNGLQNRISPVLIDPTGPLFRHLFEDASVLPECDFLMCNPPFYASKEEISRAAEDKEFDPSAVCTGADVEMITTDGEAGFIQRIVHESLIVGTHCRFYTSLLGKHSTIATIVNLLRSLKIDNYGLAEFVQGHTRRWGIVWSLGEERLPDTLVRSTSDSLHALLPLPNTFRQTYPSAITRSYQVLSNTLKGLDTLCHELEGVNFTQIPIVPESYEALATITAQENTWSRKARRRLEKLRKEGGTGIQYAGSQPSLFLTVRCHFIKEANSADSPSEIYRLVLQATWTKGKDRDLFETFWSHLSRKFLDSSIM